MYQTIVFWEDNLSSKIWPKWLWRQGSFSKPMAIWALNQGSMDIMYGLFDFYKPIHYCI